jgi:hypothetical protein
MPLAVRFTLLAALATAVACSDGGDAEAIGTRDAELGWYAANHAVAVAQLGLLDRLDAGERGDILVRCADGGRMRLVGESNHQDDLQLDAMFEDCIDEGVMIGGDLTIVASIEHPVELAEGGGSAGVFVDYRGRLRLDGDAEGACEIDVQVRTPAPGVVAPSDDEIAIGGTVCGLDARAVLQGRIGG